MLLRAYRDESDPRDPDGWFATGDLGSFDERGHLVVAGRRRELIITGGENVWPEAVEAVLREHPHVADVAVGGRSDPEWGQRVVAYVVPSASVGLRDLRDQVKQRLPAYCAPRELVLVEAIPRSALGKIRRASLTGLRGADESSVDQRTRAGPDLTA